MSQHDFYAARAAEARDEAAAAELDNVRERLLRSASVWDSLALRARRNDIFRAEEDARRAART